MLSELRVENLAIIDKLGVVFAPGLNVLTGETGAGKSIIIDAVELVLGGRASADFVRAGSERATIEALFDITDLAPVRRELAELGLDDDDSQLVLSREITRGGRSASRINGRPVTAAMLRRVTQHLVDLHGQHEHQSLLQPERHLELLDSFAGAEALALRRRVAELHRAVRRVEDELRQLTGDAKDRARQLDLLQFQLNEIDAARLIPGEDVALHEERSRLAGAEKLFAACERAYASLRGGDEGGQGAVDAIGTALAELEEMARIDAAVGPTLEALRGILYQLDDLARDLGRYRDAIEFNPERLEEVLQRLDQIAGLKRKYGDSIEEILRYREEVAAGIERIIGSEEAAASLSAERDRLGVALGEAAAALSEARRTAARALEEGVAAELADLGMPRTVLKVAFGQEEADDGFPCGGRRLRIGPRGCDQVEFLLSPNPGEPLLPLAKIASGGELSRIMLALKTILAGADEVPTVIFDEIDAGIGGRAAQAVAEKLARVAAARQVLCVTHLPQIAAMADAHYAISKHVAGERTHTRIMQLGEEERAEEVGRMLGGAEVTAKTREHAREMLALADRWKRNSAATAR